MKVSSPRHTGSTLEGMGLRDNPLAVWMGQAQRHLPKVTQQGEGKDWNPGLGTLPTQVPSWVVWHSHNSWMSARALGLMR